MSSFQDNIHQVRLKSNSYLITLESLVPDLERIWNLVQENQEFFDIRLGDDKLKAAADKLEQLVKEHNEQ